MAITRDTRVERALELIDEQLHRRLSITEVAETVGLSVSQLTRLFRLTVGTTPGAYLQECRLSRARTLVERTSLSIAEIMRQVGVSDRSHFARDFQRAYGFTPRTLRVHLRKCAVSAPPTSKIANR